MSAPIYDNLYCPICGKRMMCATNCQRHKATIHMSHCYKCEYFIAEYAHCNFLTLQIQRKEKRPPQSAAVRDVLREFYGKRKSAR